VVDRECETVAEDATEGSAEPESPAAPQTPAENVAAPANKSPDKGWAQWLRVAPARRSVASIWDDVLVVDRGPEVLAEDAAEGSAEPESPAAPQTPAENAVAPANKSPDKGWAQWLKWFGRLVGRAFQPSALLFLVMLAIIALVSIIGGLALGDTPLGKTCIVGFIPASFVGIGIVGTHLYGKRNRDAELAKAVQNATYTTLSLKDSVRYIDERLEFALKALMNNSINWGILEVVSAKTASELSFANAQQSARQWELISQSEAQRAHLLFGEDADESRPRNELGDDPNIARAGGSSDDNGDN
jgi:hypothetical protein